MAVAADAEAVVREASLSLGRLLDTDPEARGVLVDLEVRPAVNASTVDELVGWKQRELLRIAARDLLGRDALETVAAALAAMATDTLGAAMDLAGTEQLAIIGMGKLGGRELNYASDVDLIFVGEGDPAALDRSARTVVDIARRCFRVDL
ncbi:MAG: [glutamine synthetase] adenylyltransferase / [glutamine synthetase]-adenylyl-L-tyrosine, partial [Acidimicrobiaceae bacterium]